eukprot:jgi/Mesvir1/14641/Mv05311-RA.1
MQTSLEAARAELVQIKEEKTTLEARLASLTESGGSSATELAALRAKDGEMQEKVAEIEKIKEEHRRQREADQEEFEKSANAAKEALRERHEKELETLRAKGRAVLKLNGGIGKTKKNAKDSNRQLELLKAAHREESGRLIAQVETLQSRMTDLAGMNTTLQQRYQELQGEANAKLQEASTRLRELEEKAEKDLRELKVEASRRALAKLQAKDATIGEMTAKHEAERAQFIGRHAELLARLSEIEAVRNQLTAELGSAREAATKASEEVQRTRDAARDAEATISNDIEHIRQQMEENEEQDPTTRSAKRRKKYISEIARGMTRVSAEKEALAKEVSRLTAERNELSKQMHDKISALQLEAYAAKERETFLADEAHRSGQQLNNLLIANNTILEILDSKINREDLNKYIEVEEDLESVRRLSKEKGPNAYMLERRSLLDERDALYKKIREGVYGADGADAPKGKKKNWLTQNALRFFIHSLLLTNDVGQQIARVQRAEPVPSQLKLPAPMEVGNERADKSSDHRMKRGARDITSEAYTGGVLPGKAVALAPSAGFAFDPNANTYTANGGGYIPESVVANNAAGGEEFAEHSRDPEICEYKTPSRAEM